MEGKVKFFNDRKGYGFLSVEGQKEDVFCHYSAIKMTGRKSLAEGDRVSFDVVDGEKGPQAQSVVKL